MRMSVRCGGPPITVLMVLAGGGHRPGLPGSLRVVPGWGLAVKLSLAGPSSSGLGLCALRWF